MKAVLSQHYVLFGTSYQLTSRGLAELPYDLREYMQRELFRTGKVRDEYEIPVTEYVAGEIEEAQEEEDGQESEDAEEDWNLADRQHDEQKDRQWLGLCHRKQL